MNLTLPQDVRFILNTLNEKGHKAYAVGGCVRDMMLEKTPNDWDVTTSAVPEEIMEAFPKTVPTGLRHGTVTVLCGQNSYEVTTFRIDGGYADHRRPDAVTFTADICEDLARRDFTVNAMAYHPTEGVVDPFGGREDLAKKILRAVGEPWRRFDEDALRILRAFRFSAQLDFAIEEKTLAAAGELSPSLSAVSAERIRDELLKILLSNNPDILTLMQEKGVLSRILPEFSALWGVEQNTIYHIHDVFHHTIKVIESTPKNPALRLSALLHDTGKPTSKTTDEKGVDHFHGHDQKSVEIAEDVLLRLRFDNKTIATVCHLIEHHDLRMAATPKSVRKAMSRVGKEEFFNLLDLMRADAKGQNPAMLKERLEHYTKVETIAQKILEQKDALSVADLAIGGKALITLGLSGKSIGKALDFALDFVLENPMKNQTETLLEKIRENLQNF